MAVARLSLPVCVLIAVCHSVTPAWAGVTERVSLSTSGEQGNGDSDYPAISADGRFVAFHTAASNFVAGDANYTYDVFVRDRLTGVTELVSVSSSGAQGNNTSANASISADGRFVAFASAASNLVADDTNGSSDIFVRDRLEGTTRRVSLSSTGGQGRFPSVHPSIGADGTLVAFESSADDLVPGDTNGRSDIFVRDTQAGTTERVSASSAGGQGNGNSQYPRISADGRFVVFHSYASDLVPGDTNGRVDVFLHDRETRTTVCASVSSTGQQGDLDSRWPSINADGRFVAFQSTARNLVPDDTDIFEDVFVRDTVAGTTERVAHPRTGMSGGVPSTTASISADGRFVALESSAGSLVPGDTNDLPDVFVCDRMTGIAQRVSVSSTGEQANGSQMHSTISAGGRVVAFASYASNLAPGDTNGALDILVHYSGLVINGDDPCTNSTDAILTMSCSDWTDVRFRNDPGEWGPWEPCAGVKAWTFPVGDGVKRVCVQGRDAQMNESAEECDDILVDTTPPADLFLTIDGPSVCTDVRNVTLYPRATDAAYMRFRNESGEWSAWMGYYFMQGWLLSPGGGVKTVGLQCRDLCGNVSAEITDTIRRPTFEDVRCDHPQLAYVEALVSAKVTSGCSVSPLLYCPDGTITRAQMAVFIIRAMGQSPYNKPTPTFQDVPPTHWAYGFIERMYQLSITGGCSTSPMRFCPDLAVARSQMAVFLCRATENAWLNPGTPTFVDVPAATSFYGYVERLADPTSWGGTAVTSGCPCPQGYLPGSRCYCPFSPVTRGQMAVFLCRAFGIPL